jgi:hypothetical protein
MSLHFFCLLLNKIISNGCTRKNNYAIRRRFEHALAHVVVVVELKRLPREETHTNTIKTAHGHTIANVGSKQIHIASNATSTVNPLENITLALSMLKHMAVDCDLDYFYLTVVDHF